MTDSTTSSSARLVPGMKVFVTGGNGFIGSHVVRILRSRGVDVRCLLRATSNTSRIDDLAFERFIGDVRDPESLAEGMSGTDACIHLASVSSWEMMSSDELEDTIIDGTRYVLDAAVAAGNIPLVFVSSVLAVNGTKGPQVMDENAPFELHDTPMRYAIAKHAAENLVASYVREHGLPVVTVNPAEVYGPQDTSLITATTLIDFINDWPCLIIKGGTAIAHVEDVAGGIVAALDKGRVGERYILGGDNLGYEELAQLTLQLAGQGRKPILCVPHAPLRTLVRLLSSLGLPTPVVPEVLDYANRYYFVNSGKARTELGYSPREAREVLQPVVDWLEEAGHIKQRAAAQGAS